MGEGIGGLCGTLVQRPSLMEFAGETKLSDAAYQAKTVPIFIEAVFSYMSASSSLSAA